MLENALSAMDGAVQRFVSFKDQIDQLGRASAQTGFRTRLPRAERRWGAIDPAHWIRAVLPFAQTMYDRTTMLKAWVNPRNVVAGTYNDYSPRGEVDPVEAMNWSDQAAESGVDHPGAPLYCQIGTIPLFVALEGKNRVTLFKQFRTRMRVLVTPMPYPEPATLTMRRVLPFGQWILEHEQGVAVMPFPAPTMALLAEYGVKTGRSVWAPKAIFDERRIIRRLTQAQMRA